MRSTRVLLRRSFEVVLLVLGLGFLLGPARATLAVLLAWDLIAIGYIVVRWFEIRGQRWAAEDEAADPEDDPAWLNDISDRWTGFATTLVASVFGISCGLAIAASRAGLTRYLPEFDDTFVVAAVPAIVGAWFVLHFGFAERYAHKYYREQPLQGLDFPHTQRPNLLDFSYFSFTVGTNLAASDVSVTSRPLRYTVIVHEVLSFFYNAAVLGIAIAVLNGG